MQFSSKRAVGVQQLLYSYVAVRAINVVAAGSILNYNTG
jgi:hypothetical protein